MNGWVGIGEYRAWKSVADEKWFFEVRFFGVDILRSSLMLIGYTPFEFLR